MHGVVQQALLGGHLERHAGVRARERDVVLREVVHPRAPEAFVADAFDAVDLAAEDAESVPLADVAEVAADIAGGIVAELTGAKVTKAALAAAVAKAAK